MSSAHDPFSQSFDSIEVDPSRRPSPEAIEHAFASVAPRADDFSQPGFYLLDDAGGRFQVDREMGVVSLTDEALLERERFAVHAARLRVVEASGDSYEMEMQLRLTGLVPQMVGAEDALFDVLDAAPPSAPIRAVPVSPASPSPHVHSAPAALTHWTHYAAAYARAGKGELARTRRAFIQREFPAATPALAGASLSLSETPPPVGLSGDWSI